MRNVILYYLLSSIKELGVDLPLLFRRISETASKDIDYISSEFFGGKVSKESFEQLVKDLSEILKKEGLVENINLTFNEGEVTLEVDKCSYIDMAEKAQKHGGKSCPVCLIALTASIASTSLTGHKLDAVDYETDLSSKKCKIKITYL